MPSHSFFLLLSSNAFPPGALLSAQHLHHQHRSKLPTLLQSIALQVVVVALRNRTRAPARKYDQQEWFSTLARLWFLLDLEQFDAFELGRLASLPPFVSHEEIIPGKEACRR